MTADRDIGQLQGKMEMVASQISLLVGEFREGQEISSKDRNDIRVGMEDIKHDMKILLPQAIANGVLALAQIQDLKPIINRLVERRLDERLLVIESLITKVKILWAGAAALGGLLIGIGVWVLDHFNLLFRTKD